MATMKLIVAMIMIMTVITIFKMRMMTKKLTITMMMMTGMMILTKIMMMNIMTVIMLFRLTMFAGALFWTTMWLSSLWTRRTKYLLAAHSEISGQLLSHKAYTGWKQPCHAAVPLKLFLFFYSLITIKFVSDMKWKFSTIFIIFYINGREEKYLLTRIKTLKGLSHKILALFRLFG